MKHLSTIKIEIRVLTLVLALVTVGCTSSTLKGLSDSGESALPGKPHLAPTNISNEDAPEEAVLVGAGDIATCESDFDEMTARLLDGISGTVFTLGDNVYPNGTENEFRDCYTPTWGRHKARTRPAPGNHDYYTQGAAPYYSYFGEAAGDPEKGYYSYNLAGWHIVVLNSNCDSINGCGPGSEQEKWLRKDLEEHPSLCTLAYWHHPRFSAGKYENNEATALWWDILYRAGAEVILSGHDHNYQRYAPQNPQGIADPERGIRQFIVGTGGRNLYEIKSGAPNREAASDVAYGVLKLSLRPTGYRWEFVPVDGQTFTDTGFGSCR